MEEGCQIIEPRELDGLIKNPENFELVIVVYYWLIKQMISIIGDRLQDVDVRIIRVTYHGSYPAIGVFYKNSSDTIDVGPIIESSIDTLVHEKSAMDLINFVIHSNTSWKELTRKVMNGEQLSFK